jgi:hypothetical protein
VTLLYAGGSALGIFSGDPMREIVIVFQMGINTLSSLLVFMKTQFFDSLEKKSGSLQPGKYKSQWGVMDHS